VANLNSASSSIDILHHRRAMERWDIFRRYKQGELPMDVAMRVMNLKKSMFYRLLGVVNRSANYECLLPGNKGCNSGSRYLGSKVEKLIDDAYEDHYEGSSASFANVWRQLQAITKVSDLKCPSYHAVRIRILEKPEIERFRKKYGIEAADQKYSPRPGRKQTNRPLEWVQIDHTLADVILVDSQDRTQLIGRPWVTLAICKHTRLILGFYLSLLHPSAVSVAMVIGNSVASKSSLLTGLGISENALPRHGLMETIHTDNAAEFTSDILRSACESHDIKLVSRRRKHYGGHIERLIGTMMTTKVHFLRGTTFSNVLKRRDYSPEKKAVLTFQEFCKDFVVNVSVYNSTTHSALPNKSPNQVWDEYYTKNPRPKIIDSSELESFRIDFFPQRLKKIQPYGIEILGRRYYGTPLKGLVGREVLVKFDPYDLTHVFALLQGGYQLIPLSYNYKSRSLDYEMYRYERNQKGVRDGTITEDEALGLMIEAKADMEAAQQKTQEAKKGRKSEASRTHKAAKEIIPADPISGSIKPPLPVQHDRIGILDYLTASRPADTHAEDIDFSSQPKIYDGDLK